MHHREHTPSPPPISEDEARRTQEESDAVSLLTINNVNFIVKYVVILGVKIHFQEEWSSTLVFVGGCISRACSFYIMTRFTLSHEAGDNRRQRE